MSQFIPWSSQPLDAWAARYARGTSVDLGGRKTHYVEKGEGEPVILLHGLFFDTNMWSENIDALAAHFKVYALDLWGCGYSTREPLDYGYPLFAEQLLRFMDRLGIARASLVGQSMGAGTAIRFCVEHRERVNKLVLVACAGLPNRLPLLARILDIRGVGEFFGTRQHGAGEVAVERMIADKQLLQQARKDAFALVAEDSGLRRPEHEGLRKAVLERYGKTLDLAEIG